MLFVDVVRVRDRADLLFAMLRRYRPCSALALALAAALSPGPSLKLAP